MSIDPWKVGIDKFISELLPMPPQKAHKISVGYTTASTQPYQTQKANGLYRLGYHNPFQGVLYLPIYNVWSAKNKEACVCPFGYIPNKLFFARPCPLTPQHGFVESRVVKTTEELQKLLMETLAVDPMGEVMVTPYITASHNIIWTPGLLTIGTGHDGATMGKDVTRIPLVKPPYNSSQAKMYLKADIIDSPFIEAVVKNSKTIGSEIYLTQLRNGPSLPQGVDFIPTITVVKEVFLTTDYTDLLKWQEVIKNAPSGSVIWNPGGSLSDHYSIHGVCNNIPVITSYKPTIGETLIPTKQKIPLDHQSLLDGLVAGFELRVSDLPQHVFYQNSYRDRHANAVCAVLTGFHNLVMFEGKDARWIGAAIALLIRYGFAACAGEARHGGFYLEKKKPGSRSSIYGYTLNKSFSSIRLSIGRLTNALRYGNFSSNAYGGIKWASCGYALVELINSTVKFVQNPDELHLLRLLETFNLCINQAHNGGWWLGKFEEELCFNRPLNPNVSIKAGHILYDVDQIIKKGVTIPTSWKRWKDVVVKAPSVRLNKVQIYDYTNEIRLQSKALPCIKTIELQDDIKTYKGLKAFIDKDGRLTLVKKYLTKTKTLYQSNPIDIAWFQKERAA